MISVLTLTMTLHFVIDVVAMLVCSVYSTIPLFWLVVHPFIEQWRSRGRRAFALILPIWCAFIAATILILWPFRYVHFYAGWIAWAPAAVLFLLGFRIYVAAFKHFDRVQISGLAELEPARHRQMLVTGGIRSRVRHPIYLAHLCEVAGWSVGTGLIALFVLAGFAMVTGALMIAIEDRELERRFGESYRRYRRQVPAVIPSFRR